MISAFVVAWPAFIAPAQLTRAPYSAPRRHATAVLSAEDGGWSEWAGEHGVVAPKVSVHPTTDDERGKGGVIATDAIAPMEVVARIPRSVVLSATEPPSSSSWPSALTRAALSARFGPESGLRAWVEGWESVVFGGGWAINADDLGADDVRFGKMDVTGSLLATGSDNDHEIYKKFGLKCHPVIHRAAKGLAMLTRCDEGAARAVLVCRGRTYRSLRDDLFKLVETPSPRPKGSLRERCSWDVGDMLSRVLSRATVLTIDGAETCAVVPLHCDLAHCDSRGENTKLVGDPPVDGGGDGTGEVLLVATRAIERGEQITRDYYAAPRLPCDDSDGALRLLVQFGLPPVAWPERGFAGPMGGFADGEAEV